MYIISYFNDKDKTLNSCFYLSNSNINDEFDDEITNFLSLNIHPVNIYIYLPNNFEAKVLNEVISNRIPNYITCVTFEYGITGITNGNLGKKEADKLIELHKNEAFIQIFNKNNAILKAHDETEFVTQTGTYTNTFIRIGNLLIDSEEIEVLALYLIEKVVNKTFIYVDSSTILPLVYCTLLFIRNESSKGDKYILPKIKLFDISKLDYREIDSFNSLFIISTTINGKLSDILINSHGISSKDIVVIFSFEQSKEKTPLKYSVIFHDNERILLDKKFYSEKDRKIEENKKRFSIPIDNDLFIPIDTKINTILLSKDDSPKFVDDFHDRYGKYAMIECFSENTNSAGRQRDVFFKISRLLKFRNAYFFKKLTQQIVSQIPNSNTIVIHLKDEESRLMALKLLKKGKKLKAISTNEIDKTLIKLEKEETYNFYVVASCISNGKSITNISMKLREFSNSNIHYVIGFFRCNDKNAEDRIKSNLRYGRYGFDTYKLSVIENIYLPNESSNNLDWKKEQDLISELFALDNDFVLSEEMKVFLKKRQTVLNCGNLTDNLFLDTKFDCTSDTSCTKFQLNKNFAFFNNTNWEPNEVKQSQVYFTMLSIMHNYRLRKKVQQSVYNRFLLDPENFIRFNDSIIRATLLRVASTDELNYTISLHHSNKMKDIIINILKTQVFDKNKDYCIIYEFLNSLLISKLRLHNDDIKDIINNITENEHFKKDFVLIFFANKLKHLFFKAENTNQLELF